MGFSSLALTFVSILFRLAHLQSLNLAYNYFNSSQVPTSIRNFSRLRYLNLSHSSFSGEFPFEYIFSGEFPFEYIFSGNGATSIIHNWKFHWKEMYYSMASTDQTIEKDEKGPDIE
ncbi:hypothetical protein M0R45_034941 [Rubus argutus]|uniref:Uncharacterized protein n=1 Tax=Rubus argutus TaxID=59490 RepID=A0AAW1VSI0_RUBAR